VKLASAMQSIKCFPNKELRKTLLDPARKAQSKKLSTPVWGVVNCRREDSNLHSLNGNQVLNLARLPIPPLRLKRTLTSAFIIPGARTEKYI
jgi:hypothetical protein